MEHVTSFWLWSTLCVRQLRVFLDIIFSDAHRSPSPPPFQASKASFSMPSTDPKTLSDDSTRLIALLYLFLLYTQQSVCAHTHTHTAFRLLFCFLLYIFPVKFWRSTKVSERERDWRLIGGDSCRLPLTSRPPRYLSQPFSRILLPRMARKRSNSLLPRSKATIGSVQQLAKTPNWFISLLYVIRTIAEHFVVGTLAGFGVEDAEFKVNGSFLFFQKEQTL